MTVMDALRDYFAGEAPPRPRVASREQLRPGFADLLAYSATVGDGVVALKDDHGHPCGPLLAGFRYVGPDLESASVDELERVRHHVNAAFGLLDTGWMVHFEAIRRVVSRPFGSGCVSSVDALIDEERRADAQFFVTDHAVFLTYSEGRFARSGAKRLWRFVAGEDVEELQDAIEHRIDAFEEAVARFGEALSVGLAGVERLRVRDGNDELLQWLEYLVNGTWRRCRPQLKPVHLDTSLARELVWSGGSDEMSFGEDELACVGVTELPAVTKPLLLSALTVLGVEYRWSTRFIVFDYLKTSGHLRSLEKRWKQKNDEDGKKRLAEVQAARTQLEERKIRYGHYTSVVILRERVADPDDSESRRAARRRVLENARAVVRALQSEGVGAVIERLNRMEVLLGSFPGHGIENVRKPLVHTINLADLVPLACEWGGRSETPCEFYTQFYRHSAPALLQARTWTGAPFGLTLHQGDVGHTLVVGPTGAGKSALLATLCTQFGRYPGSQLFVLDYGESMLALTRAQLDGAHYRLGAEDGPQLCPLANIDTAEDRAWASGWLAEVCAERGHTLTDEQRMALDRAVDELAESGRTPAERTFLDLVTHVQDAVLTPALAGYTGGAAGRVLNGSSNALRYARFTTFETGQLRECGAEVQRVTLRYLFREIEKRLDGRPTLVVIDEAWTALRGYAGKLEDWLRTLRKKNCAVVLATQSLSEVVESPIASVVFESCQTRILLPNFEARTRSIKDVYTQRLGLTDVQVDALASVAPKRWYMYVGGGRTRLFTLDLGPVALSFVGASGREDIARVDALHRRWGDAWAEHWLRTRGLDAAAVRLSELKRSEHVRRSA